MSSTAVELTHTAPIWGLPASTPQEIAVELYLRVCDLPYTSVTSAYPYTPCTGRVQPLPVVRHLHVAVASAPSCLSFLARHHCDLDERRSPDSRALLLSLTSLLSSLDDLLEAYLHLPLSPYQSALSSHASSLSLPHAAYLRYARRRAAESLLSDRGWKDPSLVTAALRRVLDAFNALLAASPSPFLLSPLPSSADVLLASYTAYFHRLPPDLRPPSSHPIPRPHSSGPGWQEPTLSALVAERPLLWAHSARMFAEYWPAFAAHAPDPAAFPSLSLSSPSSLASYHHRWQRLSNYRRQLQTRTEAGASLRLKEGVNGLDAGEVTELPPSIKSGVQALAPLPLKRGDAWEAEVYAALTEEQKRARALRDSRLWILGGCIALFAFVLKQRSDAAKRGLGASTDASALQ